MDFLKGIKKLTYICFFFLVIPTPLLADKDDTLCGDNDDNDCHKKTAFVHCGDGTKISYRAIGDPDSKKSIVFIHGLSQQKEDWICEQNLSCSKFFTVAVDLLGHGKSSKPDNDAAYTVQNVADHVICVIKKLKLNKPIVVGHSVGVDVAIQVALDGFASKLVLIDGTPQLVPFSPQNPIGANGALLTEVFGLIQQGKIKEAATDFNNGTFNEKCTNESFLKIKRIEKKLLIKQLSNPKFVKALFHYVDNIAAGNYNFTDQQLQSIEIPTLIVQGASDILVPPLAAELLRDNIPNSFLVMFNGKGHFPFLTDVCRFHEVFFDFATGNDLKCVGCNPDLD